MSVFHNLADLAAGLKDLLRRVDILETNDGAGYTSVDEGSFRVRSNEGLLVEGSQKVSGWLIVTGTLKGVGSLLWEHIVSFTGAFTSTGPATFDGDVKITKTLDVTAATKLRGLLELLSDMRVKSGGKVTVEGSDPVTLGVTSSGAPGVEWSSGGRVVGGASSASMTYSDKTVNVGAAGAILANATNRVVITASGTTIEGALFNDLPTISATGRTPNVWCDPSTKRFYRLI